MKTQSIIIGLIAIVTLLYFISTTDLDKLIFTVLENCDLRTLNTLTLPYKEAIEIFSQPDFYLLP